MLNQRVALVTGTSRLAGIGAHIARRLAQDGLAIALTYYRAYDAEMPWGQAPQDVDLLRTELSDLGVPVWAYEIDFSQPESPAQLLDKLIDEWGRVDVLVNNATYSVDVAIDALSPEIIDKHYAVNIRAMMLLCAEFVAHWQNHPTQTHGRIINMTSGQGISPMPDNLAYAATKGAVDAFTTSLSAAIMRQNITVNAIDPGGTNTGWMSPELLADLEAMSPRGRVSLPEDTARLVSFLASEEGDWLTGQIMRSRGGT